MHGWNAWRILALIVNQRSVYILNLGTICLSTIYDNFNLIMVFEKKNIALI